MPIRQTSSVIHFRKSSQFIEAYGQSSFEVSGNRALIQLSSLLNYRHKLQASNFQKSNCCARRGLDVVKKAEAMEEEDIRRLYRLRLIIHGT